MPAELAPDQPIRNRALDPGTSFLVQAPAGSGKTTLLVGRYLALLGRVEQPEEVLAITFTRKATAEMRERVLAALSSARAADAMPQKVEDHATSGLLRELARSVSKRDVERGWELTQHPARLRILTFDALCAWLARRLPWSSGFGGHLRVVENARPLYRTAARYTLDLLDDEGSWHRPVEALLAHLDNDLPRFESLLIHMLARRDQWLPWAISELADTAGIRAGLQATLERVVVDTLEELRGTVSGELWRRLDELAAALGEREDAGSGGPGAIGTSVSDLGRWRMVADSLLTATGRWRARHAGAARWQAADVGALAVATERADVLAARLHALRGLPDPVLSDAQWRVLEALVEALRLAAGHLQLVFDERARVDFIEVALAARRALGAEQSPTDLALALDHQISHLLVDEYQDTSHTHHALLVQLTAGWVPGDGRSVFLVGDPMQSIYRFREADVGLFLWTWRHGLGEMALEPLRLGANFRADASLVAWVNRVFPAVLAPEDAPGRGAVRYEPSIAVRPAQPDGGVTVHPLIDATKEDEAARVVGIIEAARAVDPGAKVGILARARPHLTSVLTALREADIAYRGLDLIPLGEVCVVQDLLALTRALLQPSDRVAWLAVLRAPWCGLTLADLHALVGDDHVAPVIELASSRARGQRLSDDGKARLDRTLGVMSRAVAQRGRRPMRPWIEGTWLALGGPACTDPADFPCVDAYLELLHELDQDTDALEAESIMERIGACFAVAADHPGAVDVMTIHKSKGLEFDVVIVPGLERPARADPRALLTWTRLAAGRHGSELLVAPIPSPAGRPSSLYEFVRGLEREKSEHETGRLMYVAATRARHSLHLLGRVDAADGALRSPRSGSFLHRIWPAVRSTFDDELARRVREPPPPSASGPDAGYASPIRRLPTGWRPPGPPAPVRTAPGVGTLHRAPLDVSFEWAGETARHAGILVHRMLHQMARDGLDAWSASRLYDLRDRWRGELRARGVPGPELDPALERVRQALATMLVDPRGRWLLDPGHADARNELALTGPLDGDLVHAVIDRTFVADGVRWIVDYKTGAHEGSQIEGFLDREQRRYRNQLERYAMLVSRFDPRPIRLGLYFPLLRGWRAWPWQG